MKEFIWACVIALVVLLVMFGIAKPENHINDPVMIERKICDMVKQEYLKDPSRCERY